MKLILGPLLLVLVIGGIAAISVGAQEAFLAPSLAAAGFTQLFLPLQPGSRPYTIVVGQLIGAGAGFAGVHLVHAAQAGKLMGAHDLSWDRVAAVAVAVAITSVLQTAARARSPAGGTTAVVVAIGAETADAMGAMRLAIGISLVAVLGEVARRIRIRLEPADELKPSPPA